MTCACACRADFMPKKGKNLLPVPEEINLVIIHLCAILGSSQMALVSMCLMSVFTTSDRTAKKIAVRSMALYNTMAVRLNVSNACPASTE